MASTISAGTTLSTGLVASSDTTGILQFRTNGTTAAMTIDASQNVGIGTTSPSVRLDIAGTGTAVTQLIWARGNNDASFVSSLRTGDAGTSAYQSTIGVDYAGYTDFSRIKFYRASTLGEIHFFTGGLSANGTEKMRIDSTGNVGIGTSSPSTKLEVTGNAKLTGTNLSIIPSTATNSAYLLNTNTGGNFFFGIDSSTGASFTGTAYGRFLYSSGAYPMVFLTNDTERMRITSAGYVGIGTSSPAYPLTVYSSGRSISSTGTSHLFASDSAAHTLFIGDNNYAYFKFYTPASPTYLAFQYNSTELMRLDSSGNLGLGVTPSAWGGAYRAIQVGSTAVFGGNTGVNRNYSSSNVYWNGSSYTYITTSQATQLEQSDGAYYWFQAPSGTAGNAISFTQAMTLNASGFLGIGQTNPICYVDTYGSGAYTYARFWRSDEAGYGGRVGTGNTLHGPASARSLGLDGFSQISFGIAGSQVAQIDSSGNLLVGTTSAAGSRMVVNGATGGTAVLSTINSTGSGNQFGISSSLGSTGNNTNSAHFQGSTTSVGNWYLYGNGTNGFTSDRRLKKNIETTRDGYLEDICKLRVVKYNWKIDVDGTDKELGLIAQEVEQVFPKLVQDDLNRVSPDDETVYKTLKSSVIPFMLLKAIQELKAEVDALKSQLNQGA